MKKKAYGLFFVFLLLLGAAAYSIAHISGGAEYVAAAAGQSMYKLDVAKTRGTIYDRNLVSLAGGAKKRVAAVAPTIEAVGLLEKVTEGKYRDRLAAALEDGKPFLLELNTGLWSDRSQSWDALVRKLNNPCIDIFTVPERYSKNQLAPHVVGYLDGLGNGASGVELAMNDALSGWGGEASVTYQVDALGRVMAGGEKQVENTLETSRGGVALTLDSDIQRLAEQAGQSLEKGAVVVTQVPDCEILALASFPDFSPLDLSKAAEEPDAPLVNRAFCAYAPGSIFKLVPAAAEIENGGGKETFTCTGAINAGGMMFNCFDSKPHGSVDLRGALERSCNCYFIECVRALGGQTVLNTAYNLGLGAGQEFGRGLFSAAGFLPEAEDLQNPRALANFAFGQGETAVTPVQMCGLVNAIASGGVYNSPKLISGYVSPKMEFTPIQSVTDRSVKVMNASTAQTIQAAMEGTVLEGTAQPGRPDSCVAGAKTGTAQTGIYENGEELLHFWYCGYVRDETGPRYCITVLCESTPDDGGAAARTFRQIAQELGERMKKK